MNPPILNPTVTIASGDTVSAALDLDGKTLCGLYLPSTFDGTAVSFQACDTLAGTYLQLYSGGSALSVTVAASKYVALDPSVFAGVRFLKVVAGTAQSSSDTVIVAACRPVA